MLYYCKSIQGRNFSKIMPTNSTSELIQSSLPVNKRVWLVDVQLPIPISKLFTYRLPEEFVNSASTGCRVIVPFGRKKIYSALIRKVYQDRIPDGIKNVQLLIDELPIVSDIQFEFWDWMANYYLCTSGEVMNAALPSGLKLQSETQLLPRPEFRPDQVMLSDEEFQLYELIENKNQVSLHDAARLLDKKNIYVLVKKLLEKEAISVSEELKGGYKPKYEYRYSLAPAYQSDEKLQELFLQLEQDKRKAKQLEMLMSFLKIVYGDKTLETVSKKALQEESGFSASALQTLVKNKVLEEQQIRVDRIPVAESDRIAPLVLNEMQAKGLSETRAGFAEKEIVLLHGVTSSGKTEVYIHLIDEAVRAGKQVLYLLPEIALTAQIINRLRKHFGDRVGVFHSRYSNHERVEVWNHVHQFDADKSSGEFQPAQIILGARSALFLPYSRLGLVLVDEEHDSSYKQQDPAPRYHGRDAALMLARMHAAKVLLGSATPSLESYFNASQGKYALVEMSERYGGIQMPSILIADTKEARRKKLMKSHFTPQLLDAVREALVNKEQVILFQNRRGFSAYIECRQCSWIPHCKNCSVTLTYHKFSNQIKCHYCGYAASVPGSCQDCGDQHLEVIGFGTEKIEEEISTFFPNSKVARMDLDTTRSRQSYLQMIEDFEERKVDILVGTQMVTKGLDFEHVSTVGILNADQSLNFPDFRSFERSFQLMAQVSGRSGRKNKQGLVIIQSAQPEHWVIQDVVKNNYKDFYSRDLNERSKFQYPPFSRLIEIQLKHKEEDLVAEAATLLAEDLRKKLGTRIIGPHLPLVSKIKTLYLRVILIRIERESSPDKIKNTLKETLQHFSAQAIYKSVGIQLDVDPY